MLRKGSVVVLIAFSFATASVVESSRNEEKIPWALNISKGTHGKLYHNNLNKDDFIDPSFTTVQVVNRTMQTLGGLAIFAAFIVKPIIYAIFAAAGSPIYELRTLNLFPNETKILSGRGILDRDRCIERISCEIGNYANRRSYMRRFLESVFPTDVSFPDGITGRIIKTLSKQSGGCFQYSCDPVGFLIRLFIYKIDWNTLLKS